MMWAFLSKWFSRAWIVFAYFCPGTLGVLVSVLLSAGIVLGLQLVQVSVVVIYSVVGNAVIRRIFEAYYHGQLPPSFEPIFLSPTNAAIIGAIGAPIYIVVGIMGWTIYYAVLAEDDLEDNNEDDGADYCLARAHHRASLWPLLSLSFGITTGAMIFRLRHPAISVGYSALCGWAGVVVLFVPLVLSDVLLKQLASKVLGPACAFMLDMLCTHLGKGYELWNIAAEGKIALPK